MSIVIEVLKKKRNEISKKRDKLLERLQYNHYSEIINIRQGFKDVVAKYGVHSKEALKYAKTNAGREKHLLDEAISVNKNHDKIFNKVMNYDRQISELSEEISKQEVWEWSMKR